MVGVVEHGDAAAAGVLAGDLDAVLDGLGARVDQHGLLGEVAGGVLGEQFGDPHVLLVRRDGEERVHHVAELLLRGRDDVVVGVADGGDADAGAEVEELRCRRHRPGSRRARARCTPAARWTRPALTAAVAARVQGDRLRAGDRGDHPTLGGNGC